MFKRYTSTAKFDCTFTRWRYSFFAVIQHSDLDFLAPFEPKLGSYHPRKKSCT